MVLNLVSLVHKLPQQRAETGQFPREVRPTIYQDPKLRVPFGQTKGNAFV